MKLFVDGQAEQELVFSWLHSLHAVAVVVEARYSSNQAAVVAVAVVVVGCHRAVMSWQVVYLLPVVLRPQEVLCSLAAAGGVAAADVAVAGVVVAADVAADAAAADVAVAGAVVAGVAAAAAGVAVAGVAAVVPRLQRRLARQ